jgi:hypothetical protein
MHAEARFAMSHNKSFKQEEMTAAIASAHPADLKPAIRTPQSPPAQPAAFYTSHLLCSYTASGDRC